MTTLSPTSMLSRLRLDFEQVLRLDADPSAPVRATGHRSGQDARAGTNPVSAEATNPPTVYRLEYHVVTLAGPDLRHPGPTVIVMNLLGNANYPFTPPVCHVVSRPLPWTPHFHAMHPVCIGEGAWLATGRRTAADLVVHIGRLLNFDEPPPAPGYSGYNGAAIAWWNTHGFRPLDPDLLWPIVDPNSGDRRPLVRSVTAGPAAVRATPAHQEALAAAARRSGGPRTVTR